MFREYKPSRALRSKDSGQLVQSRVQTKHGEAAFSCYEKKTQQHFRKHDNISENITF